MVELSSEDRTPKNHMNSLGGENSNLSAQGSVLESKINW